MELDASWDALTKPGNATDYFNLPAPSPLQIGSDSFNPLNAWWLAEIARLSYHPDYHNKLNINLGCFKYKKIAFIDNINTSTHISLLKVNGIDLNGENKACLVIAFRGTDDLEDWNTNLHAIQRPYGEIGKVHSGFKDAYLSIRSELLDHLNNNSMPVFITGHSLGAALATLTVSELYKSKFFDSCYTFGSPRTGNPVFVDSINCNKIYRVINNCDLVTIVPLDFTAIKYKHVGSSYLIDDQGNLIEGMSEEEIVAYQISKAHGLMDYAVSQFKSKDIKQIKNKLPPFLSDHAPINYSLLLENLLRQNNMP